jgi:DNA-binding Lrp family transcriptional regulator
MSKGPGKIERGVLAALEKKRYQIIQELAEGLKASQPSVRRAVRNLKRQGLVKTCWFGMEDTQTGRWLSQVPYQALLGVMLADAPFDPGWIRLKPKRLGRKQKLR